MGVKLRPSPKGRTKIKGEMQGEAQDVTGDGANLMSNIISIFL
jgi:hypothetical protein